MEGEGSDIGLIKVLLQHLPESTGENDRYSKSG
jgi:hypothetical protein